MLSPNCVQDSNTTIFKHHIMDHPSPDTTTWDWSISHSKSTKSPSWRWRENHTSHYLCSQTLLTLWNFAECYPMSTARRDTWCQGLELTWKLSVHPKWALSWATEKHEHVHPTHPHVSSFPLYQMIHPYAGKTLKRPQVFTVCWRNRKLDFYMLENSTNSNNFPRTYGFWECWQQCQSTDWYPS